MSEPLPVRQRSRSGTHDTTIFIRRRNIAIMRRVRTLIPNGCTRVPRRITPDIHMRATTTNTTGRITDMLARPAIICTGNEGHLIIRPTLIGTTGKVVPSASRRSPRTAAGSEKKAQHQCWAFLRLFRLQDFYPAHVWAQRFRYEHTAIRLLTVF